MDPVGNKRNNLQNGRLFRFVTKSFLVSHRDQINAQAPTLIWTKIFFGNTLEPIPKQICNVFRWCQTERHMDDAAYYLSKRALKEQVLYGLLVITKTTMFITYPISFSQVFSS
jgi:hypothetical protein